MSEARTPRPAGPVAAGAFAFDRNARRVAGVFSYAGGRVRLARALAGGTIGPGDRVGRRARPGPGYDPGARGHPGVVARSDVDAVAGCSGEGGGPVMGHDGGDGTSEFLGGSGGDVVITPGAPGVDNGGGTGSEGKVYIYGDLVLDSGGVLSSNNSGTKNTSSSSSTRKQSSNFCMSSNK